MSTVRPVRSVIARGSTAGLCATALMSVVFAAGDRSGALDTPPPRKIIDRFLPQLPPKPSDRLALATHLGYGTVGGVAYEALVGRGDTVLPRRLIGGVLYGLAVWAASYEGWVPAIGVLPKAHHDKPGRASTVLVAHLVYGASLGVAGWLASRRAGR